MSAPDFPSADALLEDLGITGPDELDLTVIAQHCRATILYKPLEGCAARITGNEDRAIITVDSNSRKERQRFSAGHELGHWMFDRGKVSLFSCEEHVFVKEWSKNNPETRANRFASDLLMPAAMFKPRAATFKRVDFNAVRALAKAFTTSLTATAIRLVEHGPLPAMLVCSSADGVEWSVRGDGKKPLWPQKPGPETYACDVLNAREDEASGDVLASAWFDHPIADRYQVHEHSIRVYQGLVLSLLWWRNETMLIHLDDYEEERDARRSDSWHR
jgi:Zn-dependent peptidase ImmA (M78 family)